MVDRIGIRELRQHASRYLARVKAGESIEVTDRGNPIAVLIPVTRDSPRERLISDGRLTPRPGPPVLPVPVHRGPSTAEVLDELRAERL